ncbi:MAG TPA: hypothetical protein VJB16_04570 [archaeon]|nr:hypothetical protein [archaeon]
MDQYFRLGEPRPYDSVLKAVRELGDSLFGGKPLEWDHANADEGHLFPSSVKAYHELQLDIDRPYTASDCFHLSDGRSTVVPAATAQVYVPAGPSVQFVLLRFHEDFAIHPAGGGKPKRLAAYAGDEELDPVLAEAIRAHFAADLGVLVPRLSEALGTPLTKAHLQRNGP